MSFKKILLLGTLVSVFVSNGSGEETFEADSSKVYLLEPIYVNARRTEFGTAEFPVSEDKFISTLNVNGFNLIRKGTFFAQDLYVDGFKRAEIPVVVDGERYHSACPNRMDSPLTRLNPLEMDIISMQKQNNSLYGGLGGYVHLHRLAPTENRNMRSAYSQSLGASAYSDLATSVNAQNHRLDIRYATGEGYDDGDGVSYKDKYGYKEDYRYTLAEGVINGVRNEFSYRGAFTYTENVMFPYLRMDERLNRAYNGNLSYKKHKLYVTYTDHLMDNQLRVSNMFMETDARNLTVGLTSDYYEAIYRNWDADNTIITPMGMTINNHLIPDVDQFSGSLFKTYTTEQFVFSGRAGMQYSVMGDEPRLEFFKPLYPDADRSTFYLTGALTGAYQYRLNANVVAGFTGEVATTAPEIEQMYISVVKPMMNPYWAGNPTLNQPVKSGVRGMLKHKHLYAELFASHVWHYVSLVSRSAGMQPYLTYDNIDAYMLGGLVTFKNKYIKSTASYTYAQNRTTDSPLSEIPPFSLTTTVKAPSYNNMSISVTHTYADAQTRVDPNLTERKTGSWHRLDMAVSYLFKTMALSLEVENITDETYSQHLSYLRDPFSSGVSVTDPGRTFRLSLFYTIE